MVRPNTIVKCMSLELVWLGKAIMAVDNNEHNAMYRKFNIKWWEPISLPQATRKTDTKIVGSNNG